MESRRPDSSPYCRDNGLFPHDCCRVFQLRQFTCKRLGYIAQAIPNRLGRSPQNHIRFRHSPLAVSAVFYCLPTLFGWNDGLDDRLLRLGSGLRLFILLELVTVGDGTERGEQDQDAQSE